MLGPPRLIPWWLFWPGMAVGLAGVVLGVVLGVLLGIGELVLSRNYLREEKLYDLVLPAGTHLGLVLGPWLWILAAVGGAFVLVWGMVVWTRKV